LGGMSKTFRPWKIDEPLFLPPTVQDFVAKDHLAHLVLSLVRDDLDLAEITGTYGSERGQPPFDPTMMTVLLLYSYCCGIYSSRRSAKGCRERVDFISIVGLDAPDFRTISDFRKRHLQALGKLFGQILLLCEKSGLVKLGHVALDGTKIKANASKHKAMSYERMEQRAAELEAQVAKWLSAAEAADAEEDKLHGHDKTGEEMPAWVADKQQRAERIRKAKAELEAEAKAAVEAKLKAEAEVARKREADGRKKPGPKGTPPSAEPDAKAQKNFTDPDSRIMKSKDGFVQAYNAQAAVDAEAQIIVAQDVTQSAVDSGPTGADDRCGRDQSRPQARAAIGGRRLLLGGQSRGVGEAQHRCVCGDRPGQGCCRWHGQRRGHRCSTGQPRGGRTDTGRGDACQD
jgi:transposase